MSPATSVGIENGRSMTRFMSFLPGNSYRTSTYATSVPITALITAMIPAVSRVSAIALRGTGRRIALAIAPSPSETPRRRMVTIGRSTISPRYATAVVRRPYLPHGRDADRRRGAAASIESIAVLKAGAASRGNGASATR